MLKSTSIWTMIFMAFLLLNSICCNTYTPVSTPASCLSMTREFYNRGIAYEKLGDYQKEIESYKETIRLNPDDAEAHFYLGVTYGKLEDYQKARESFKEAIRIKPDLADAHYNLGCTYVRLGDYKKAIESCKQAIRIKPNDAEAHYSLGITYLLSGNRGSALEQYKILKELDKERANKLFDWIYN